MSLRFIALFLFVFQFTVGYRASSYFTALCVHYLVIGTIIFGFALTFIKKTNPEPVKKKIVDKKW